MTITEFLLARIAEDEAAARAAAPWATGSRHEGQPLDWSIHFDRWSPARVLAECAAKRAILADYQHEYRMKESANKTVAGHPTLYYGYPPDTALRHLAAIYKNHPDYRQEWAA